jgi:hypothetical protein
MFTTKNNTTGDVLFLDGDHFRHVSLQCAVNTGKKKVAGGKLVAQDIGQTLSVYIYFFHKYCKGNPKSVTRLKQTIGHSNLLFVQSKGGPWKNLKRNVRDYSKVLELNIHEMGLGNNQNTTSYIHMSRIAWVAARASFSDNFSGHARVSVDGSSVGLGFTSESKYSFGMPSLRELQRARTSLGDGPDTLNSNSLPQLNMIDSDEHGLYPLLVEMTKKRHEHHPRLQERCDIPEEEISWTDIYDDDTWFSQEYINGLGKYKTVREFWYKYGSRFKPPTVSSSSMRTRSSDLT